MDIDYNLIQKLHDSSGGNGEGSTLHFGPQEVSGKEEQLRFKEECLRKYSPSVLLETGTNKAEFCYLSKLILPTCTIHTFDLNDWSLDCVNAVCDYFNEEFVTFHKGDSQSTLSVFNPPVPIDFAHVDGGHDYNSCLSDLTNCDRLNIPTILVDDYRGIPSVGAAMEEFCKTFPYSLISQDNASKDDSRGLALLQKKIKKPT